MIHPSRAVFDDRTLHQTISLPLSDYGIRHHVNAVVNIVQHMVPGMIELGRDDEVAVTIEVRTATEVQFSCSDELAEFQ